MIDPHKSETPAGTGEFAEENTERAAIVAPSAGECNAKRHAKRLATLHARAALAGVVLHAIEGDFGKTIYIVSRWHLTRQLDGLDEAEVWLDRAFGRTP